MQRSIEGYRLYRPSIKPRKIDIYLDNAASI
jgi:hypothetical protein